VDQQVGAEQQMFRFVGGEPEIAKDMAARRHGQPICFSHH
jgi:hypothetical protein